MVLDIDNCERCNVKCNTVYFQHNFDNWTSGNNDIDKLIQSIQLSVHINAKDAIEWIPYNKLYNIKYIVESDFGKVYSAEWYSGCIIYWSSKYEKWIRDEQNMSVTLISLNDPTNITLKFINEITATYKICGITQDLKTRNYMVVFDINKCRICKTNDFDKMYKARWIDGCIYKWDVNNQNWKRHKQNMFVTLKYLNNQANITLKFINKIAVSCKVYGITQDSKTKNYLVVLDIDNCKRCKIKCNTIYFQHNFDNWTSGNNDIDKFI
ncbi:kinase-like domain-containing protein [Rhizophagus clarus]|uniref:Kinase-like domain-containing protein n=1 Tax=Rhizophagus clarus TaxID=94130 RepID=A0A8H3MC79_9GLOM|nr:kinase-like domain-containing protein [Rhizophagus clarus]